MTRRLPISTRTDTLFPDTTLFRSEAAVQRLGASSCRFNARILRRYCALTTAHAPRLAGGDFGPIQNNNRHRRRAKGPRSEEHTSELQSLMRISYAVFCLKKKIKNTLPITPPKQRTSSMKDKH